MNLFSNITRGGQLQIHQLRMFQQIFCFALIISFIISFAVFCYGVKQNIPEKDAKYTYHYIKARFYLIIGTPLNKDVKQLIDYQEVSSSDITRHPIYYRSALKTLIVIKKQAFEASIYFIVCFISIFTMWFLYGRNHKKTDITKGKSLISNKALHKILHQQNIESDIVIESLPLVKNRELQHILVTGTTGSGKSNLFNIIIPQVRNRPNKALIIDVTGEYIAKFYNPNTDFIFNPFDVRSINWNIWADLQIPSHYEAFAASIIPSKKYQNDDIWDASARIVLVEVLKKLKEDQRVSELLRIICESSIRELEDYLKDTNAAKIITASADKTTLSVLMNLTTQITPLKLLQNSNNDNSFSVRNWIAEDNNNSWLFISARSDQIDSLRPLISAITDTALNALLSLDPSTNRRIWFIIDELAKLNKLMSLAPALAESRKYGGAIIAGIQSIAQLNDNYGHALAQSITDMFSTFFFFRSQNPMTTEWIAKILGVVEQEELNEHTSYGASSMKDGVSFSKQTKSKQLVLPIEIANIPDLTAYVKYASLDATKLVMEYQQTPVINQAFILQENF